MYAVKMAFVLVQVGTNLWINPMQVQGIRAIDPVGTDCRTLFVYLESDARGVCSDWTIEQVREALKPSAVSKALEGK